MSDSLFWADTIAGKVIKQWNVSTYRTEMGIGASGIPHVGSTGDAVRSYVVALGIEDQEKKSELIAFSDDRDGLRKVPAGFPPGLRREIGKPVSMIPDPFGCHKSFALHVSSLLEGAFKQLGVKYELKRSHQEYKEGTFDEVIVEILNQAKKAGQVIKRTTGSEKYLKQLPFMPICQSCGRVYTTRAHTWNPDTKKVGYDCDLSFEGKAGLRPILIKGCGNRGEAGIREGKLAWKVEFAARWKALDIHYEAFGKDILDSVRCNDAICREILGREPPVHSFYELFTERGGSKLSKSKGNVFNPQRWMRLGSPEILRLLFLKRLGTARVVDEESIPPLLDEVDELDQFYFDPKGDNERQAAHKKRLFEYMHFLKIPKEAGLQIAHRTLVNIVASLPIKNKAKVILEIVQDSLGDITFEQSKELKRRIDAAILWTKREKIEQEPVILTKVEKKALTNLYDYLEEPHSADDIQTMVFIIAKERAMKPTEMFRLVYKVLIGMDKGPRAGKLIMLLGRSQVRKLIWDRL